MFGGVLSLNDNANARKLPDYEWNPNSLTGNPRGIKGDNRGLTAGSIMLS